MPGNDAMEVTDYGRLIRRRKVPLGAAFILILLAAAVVAYSLPTLYRSTTTIQIERQEIPPEFVDSPITGFVNERLEAISQRTLTADNLWPLVQKYDLYSKERKSLGKQEVIDLMRQRIVWTPISVDAVDPRNSRSTTATVAFTLSFDGPTPKIAQQVTTDLAALYLHENSTARTHQAETVSKFLTNEADRLRAHILEMEQKLADFKQNNVNQLPEVAEANRRSLELAQQQLSDTIGQIQALEDRKITLEAQVAQTPRSAPVYGDDGKRVLNPDERLALLRTQYLQASAIYSPEHPDVIRLRTEIQALERQTGASTDGTELRKELELQEHQLAEARQKYSENHPDVKRLEKSVNTLKASIHRFSRGAATKIDNTPADNPVYITLRSQLDTVKANLSADRARLTELKNNIAMYQRRLMQTPMVEREYLALTRDYESVVKKYNEMKDKATEAQIAVTLEKDKKGERYSVIDPASLPTKPQQPNRVAIMLLGAVLAVGGGLGSATVSEYMDRSIRGIQGLLSIMEAPPIVVLPYIENQGDQKRKRRGRVALAFVIVVVVTTAIGVGYSYWNQSGQQTTAGGIGSTVVPTALKQ